MQPIIAVLTSIRLAIHLVIRHAIRFAFRATMVVAITTAATAIAFAAPSSFQVDVTGKGTPMILIPGLASSGEVWDSTVKQFCGASGKYECHVLTLAGFAGVAPITTPLLATAAKEIVEYMDTKKMVRPIVIGHSLGGFLAMQLAASHPDKFGRIIIVDSLPALGALQMPDITPEQLKSMAGRMRDGMKKQNAAQFAAGQRQSVSMMVTKPEDLERILGWGGKSDNTTVINAMHDLFATDLRQDIARIQSPTLVLGSWFAYKDFTTRAAVEGNYRMQFQKLNGVTIELADTARHFIMADDPKWMFERIEKFLQ